jgi:hypothetical protein
MITVMITQSQATHNMLVHKRLIYKIETLIPNHMNKNPILTLNSP